MPARSETRSIDAFLTTTLAEYLPTLQDNVFDDVPLLSYLNGKLGKAVNGAKRTLKGGERIVEPLLYGRNSTAKSYAGAEQLSTNIQDGITNAVYDWAQYSVAISITGLQQRGNQGTHKLIDLLQAKATQAELSIQEILNQDLWASSVGNNGKNVTGIPFIVKATGTLGGINQSTNTWWAASVDSSGTVFLTSDAGIKAMRTKYNDLTIGNIGPDIIFMTQSTFENYEQTGQEDRRYTSNKILDAGFQTLVFKGRPVVFDRDMPTGEMYFLNGKFLKWVAHKDADLTMTSQGFQTPIGQDTSVAMILLQANTTCSNRRRLGAITVIT